MIGKKGRARTRLILDCRRSNRHFVEAPGVDLLSAEGLSRIERTEEGARLGPVVVGAAAVKDCFHRLRVSLRLGRFFCCPRGSAKEFGMSGKDIDVARLGAGNIIGPCAAVLHMGWRSLYFAQSANYNVLCRTTMLRAIRVATDRGGAMVLGSPSEGGQWRYLYADSIGVFSRDETHVKQAMAEATEGFNGAGLLLHEGAMTVGGADVLGVTVDGERERTALTNERFWRVRKAVRYGLQLRGGISGQELEVLVGHSTFCGLAVRESLSVGHASCELMEKRLRQPGRALDERAGGAGGV